MSHGCRSWFRAQDSQPRAPRWFLDEHSLRVSKVTQWASQSIVLHCTFDVFWCFVSCCFMLFRSIKSVQWWFHNWPHVWFFSIATRWEDLGIWRKTPRISARLLLDTLLVSWSKRSKLAVWRSAVEQRRNKSSRTTNYVCVQTWLAKVFQHVLLKATDMHPRISQTQVWESGGWRGKLPTTQSPGKST